MSSFFKLIYRDEKLIGDKIVLTYLRTDEPNWLVSWLGAKPKYTRVKFIGKDYDWKLYPNGPECTHDQMMMLRRDAKCKLEEQE